MKSSYQLSEQIVNELKQYLGEQEQVHAQIKALAASAKVHLRTAVAVDIKSHPRLLYIYNEFMKMKDVLDQHLLRKEQLLFPFLSELVFDEEPGYVVNGKAVNSFLKVFSDENDRIAVVQHTIDEATGHYKTDTAFPPGLKQAFFDLSQLSKLLISLCERENTLFLKIYQSRKQSTINKIRRA